MTLSLWHNRLESAARRTLGSDVTRGATLENFILGFTDEQGNRRPVDRAFLMATLWTAPGALPVAAKSTPDADLWQAVWDPTIDVDHLLEAGDAAPLLHHATDPPEAIEVWTESELCALHALWHLARSRARPDYRQRCVSAARWHVEHTQPDNATGRPWAIHVFATIAAEHSDPNCDLYAQTLLHNTQVAAGKPDHLSAFILLHAANELAAELPKS